MTINQFAELASEILGPAYKVLLKRKTELEYQHGQRQAVNNEEYKEVIATMNKINRAREFYKKNSNKFKQNTLKFD